MKLVRKVVGGRGRRLSGEDVHGKTYLPFVRFQAEETTFLFPQIWVHRAVEVDATALFGKWSARSYPDWEMFVQKEVGKCATDVRGWRCVHDARLRQVGEVGLIIFVPQVSR